MSSLRADANVSVGEFNVAFDNVKRGAALGDAVHVNGILQQQAGEGGGLVEGGHQQRGVGAFVHRVGAGAAFQQHVGNGKANVVGHASAEEQRGVVREGIGRIGVGASGQEGLDNIEKGFLLVP